MLDLIVIGLGVYGSSVVAEAGARGLSTLGLEQFPRGHDKGSSHGRSRIFRLTTVEGDELALRARRALDLWKGYDADAGGRILIESGFAIVQSSGAEDRTTHDVANVIERAETVARRQQIAHEMLSGTTFSRRYSGFAPLSAADRVYFEPHAFLLRADEALATITARAASFANVDLAFETVVVAVRRKAGFVEVEHRGGITRARHVVLSTGPWLQRNLLGDNAVNAAVLPQYPLTALLDESAPLPQFPAFVHISPDRPTLYGLPATEQLREIKFGIEQERAVSRPGTDALPRDFETTSREVTLSVLNHSVPMLTNESYVGDLCYYTKTDNSQHIVQQIGAQQEVTVVSACSGHGFKYAPAIAEEIVASLSK
jgi:sarcosine oxidase